MKKLGWHTKMRKQENERLAFDWESLSSTSLSALVWKDMGMQQFALLEILIHVTVSLPVEDLLGMHI